MYDELNEDQRDFLIATWTHLTNARIALGDLLPSLNVTQSIAVHRAIRDIYNAESSINVYQPEQEATR